MGNPTFSSSSEAAEYSRRTAYYDGTAPSAAVRKRRRSKNAARPGEQVAAKVTRTDENGSWILASVQRFYADTETYDVQDEDDTTKLIRLPWNHVMRLSTGAEGCFKKGTQCMAISPETTSFYRASKSLCYFLLLFL
jgi:SAGA-associated factor 29